jgi:hypothetical protein
MPFSGLLPAIGSHPLAIADPSAAHALSDMLKDAVTPGTASTYASAFSQLVDFCASRGMPSLPVSNVTLAAWLTFKAGQGVKAKSLSKYVCGVRHAHILHLGQWHLSNDSLVSLTLRAAGTRAPSSNKLRKSPLSLDTILRCCHVMPGWPILGNLLYDDLLWITASVIAFFAALRGGEFFVREGSSRPVLRRSMLTVVRNSGPSAFIRVDVPSPKTNKQRSSEPALAMDPGSHFELSPIRLWLTYDSARRRHFGIQPQDPPAFQLQSGEPLSGSFMLGRARDLCRNANLQVLDCDGRVVPVGAASWRAGYVLSAKNAHISDSTICANGRWRSLPSAAPYSFESTRSLGQAATSISSLVCQGGPSATFAGGRFLSDNVLHHGF